MKTLHFFACTAACTAWVVVGCSSDDSSSIQAPAGAGGAQADASDAAESDAGTDTVAAETGPDAADAEAGVSCGRVPGPADGDRIAVVSHPYDASAGKADVWELMKLTAAGALSATGEKFTMGRGVFGNMVFTPDGEVGIAVQEDGTLGVVRITSAGKAEVVAKTFKGAFYAARLLMHPSGDKLYVLDSQWVENGGGIYSVRIGCDGKLTDEGRILEAKLPYSMEPIPNKQGTYAIASKDLLGSAPGDDAHLLTIEPSIKRVASADSFPDDEQIVASGAVTSDGRYALFGDNSELSGIPNRIAVLEIGDTTITQRQMIPDLNDPYELVASPFGDLMLMVSGYGNAFKLFKYDPSNATTPFSALPDMTYNGVKPQLPGGAVMIERGQLKGRVLVVENEGVRMVQFKTGGADDLGLTSAGTGMEGMTGVVGVQP
jgi:hypothetical protein